MLTKSKVDCSTLYMFLMHYVLRIVSVVSITVLTRP